MFDPGFWELMVIAVLALLVVGPERLPVVARKVGLWVGKARRYVTSVRSDIERELRTDDLERMLNLQNSEIQELKSLLTDTKKTTEDSFKETGDMLRASTDALMPPPAESESDEDSNDSKSNDTEASKADPK